MEDEIYYDRLLNIHTTGRDDSISNSFNFPYEATPYMVLNRLVNSGYITKKNTVLDYGCGKGRVDFFLSFQTKCNTIGIEYDKRLYNKALENLSTSKYPYKISFFLENAEDYIIPITVDRLYFFNPFCVDILKSAVKRLKDSLKIQSRNTLLFFYYPSDKYISYLEKEESLALIDTIDCVDLYKEIDSKERILVYEMKL